MRNMDSTNIPQKKKRILVVYYSQSGQLKKIVKSILEDAEKNESISITYEALRPKKPYPFPWNRYEFCDTLPESVKGIPCELEELKCDPNIDYDLVILAYTIWFLSPSIPINSFFHTEEAKKILHRTPVLTVIGCRNMWVLSQQKIKRLIHQLNGQLAGNIVLTDRAPNLIGIVTIARWMLTGKKKRVLGVLPKPGVSDQDIADASRFGQSIANTLLTNEVFDLDQKELNRQGAVKINHTLYIMEKRVSRIFKIWSGFILKKGGAGDRNRKNRIWGFYFYLNFVIILIVPIISFLALLTKLFRGKSTKKKIELYELS